MATGRTLPPADPQGPWPDPGGADGGPTRAPDGPDAAGDELDRLRREGRAAVRALEVKDAYITYLDDELRACREREWRRTRLRRGLRGLGPRVAAAVPPEVKVRVRSWRGDR